MNIRETLQTQSANTIGYLRQQQAAVAKYQDQITSGQRVQVASDDPAAYSSAALSRTLSARYTTYQGTITSATDDLNNSVSTLQDTSSALTQAKSIAQQAIDPTLGPTENEALATQVDSLIDQTLRGANTKTDSGYLYGGANATSPPFQVATTDANGRPATISYSGSSSRSQVLIGPNSQTVDTKSVGSTVFQAGGGDTFAALIALRDTLRDTTQTQTQRSAALSQNLSDLDAAQTQISTTIGHQSGSLANLSAIQSHLSDLKLTSDSRTSELVSTDYTDALVKLNEQQTAFQATLAVAGKFGQTSLLDYIK